MLKDRKDTVLLLTLALAFNSGVIVDALETGNMVVLLEVAITKESEMSALRCFCVNFGRY
jgi:hypothetical protein